MRSPFSSLLLATSLVAPPAGSAPEAATFEARQESPAVKADAQDATAARAKARKPGKASPAARSGKSTKSAKGATSAKTKKAPEADCDDPPKVTAAKPPAVPADPFAPIVAPCADPKS